MTSPGIGDTEVTGPQQLVEEAGGPRGHTGHRVSHSLRETRTVRKQPGAEHGQEFTGEAAVAAAIQGLGLQRRLILVQSLTLSVGAPGSS